MIRMASLRETITIFVRSAGEAADADRYGDVADEESEGTDVAAAVSPVAGGQELEQNRDTRISRYVVLVAPEATVDGLARVEWKGRSFDVIGEPRIYTLHGATHHYEFTMEEVLG